MGRRKHLRHCRVDLVADTSVERSPCQCGKTNREGEEAETDLQKVTEAVGDIQGYSKALQEYIKLHPTGSRANKFKQASEEHLSWQAVADWSRLAQQWRQIKLIGLQPAKAKELDKLATAVADTFADSAEGDSMHEILCCLKDNRGAR